MKYSTDVEWRSDSLAVISYRDINQFTYVNLSYAGPPNSFTNLRALLVLHDRGILADLTSVTNDDDDSLFGQLGLWAPSSRLQDVL
jgi:hypothetical protein